MTFIALIRMQWKIDRHICGVRITVARFCHLLSIFRRCAFLPGYGHPKIKILHTQLNFNKKSTQITNINAFTLFLNEQK